MNIQEIDRSEMEQIQGGLAPFRPPIYCFRAGYPCVPPCRPFWPLLKICYPR
jgi:hypothetical protein